MRMRYFQHRLLKENSIEYREYQERLSNMALKQNTLVVLPTGTGKTIIALLTAVKWRDIHPNAKIFFLAPTRPLVNQHYQLFNKNLKHDVFSLAVLTGEIRPDSRRLIWTRDVIFATPQLMYNDLVRGYVDIKEDDLLILDEVHKAVGNHPYVKIVKLLTTRNIYPRILALTASPGDKEKTLTIMENLNIENLEVHTQEDPIVSRYFHGYSVIPIFIELDPLHNHMINLVRDALNSYIERLNSIVNKYGVSIDKKKLSYTYLTETRDRIIEEHHQVMSENELKSIKKIFYEIILLERILTYIEIYTFTTTKRFLDEIFGSGKKIKRRGTTLYYSKELKEVFHLLSKAIEKNVLNRKTEKLVEIIKKGDFKKALVFTSLKENALEILDVLNREGINAGILIGQTRSKEGIGMKQVQQLKTLDDFNRGITRVLIATHVGEEGLDISEVDLVVFFDNPISAVRRIQRMGRTGRRERGRVIFLINRGTREEVKYYVSTRKYRRLIAELRELKEMLEKSKRKSLDTFMHIEENKSNNKLGEGYFVYVDVREKTSIINLLTKKGIPVKIENLEVGDYIVGNHIIERKTIDDLARSTFDGRIFSQLKVLSNLKGKKLILVIEGKKVDFLRYSSKRTFLGILYTIIVDFGIPVYFSEDEEETAELIGYLYSKSIEKKEKTEKMRYEKKPKDIYEIQKFVLSGIPGIDSKIAERILAKFGSLRNVANASITQLMEVKGIGQELALRIYRVFNHSEKKDRL